MNARVITNARIATKIAPATSIHGFKPYFGARFWPKPATFGSDGRGCGNTGRSNESCAVGVASRGGRCGAIGGPQFENPGFDGPNGITGGRGAATGAPGAGAPGSVGGIIPGSGAGSGCALCGGALAGLLRLLAVGGALGGRIGARAAEGLDCDCDCDCEYGSRETGCGCGVLRSRDWNSRVSSLAEKCWCGGVLPSTGVTGSVVGGSSIIFPL